MAYTNALIDRVMQDIGYSQQRNARISQQRAAQNLLSPSLSSTAVGSGSGSGLPSGPVDLTQILNPKTGAKITVAKSAAGKFESLLRGLMQMGYPIQNVSGYANRNIAGTNTPSFHSKGLAIDIDPTPNRGNRIGDRRGSANGYFNYGQIAPLLKQLGITWGGTWKSPDPMHFSIGE